MARKLYCSYENCKYHGAQDVCNAKKVEIGYGGICKSFRKGFLYYVDLVKEALSGTNFILGNRMNNDLRIGLYYVMQIFDLKFVEMDYGGSRLVMLRASEAEQTDQRVGLTYKEIAERPMKMDVFEKLYQEFQAGILPGPEPEEKPNKPLLESQPFGWLSPDGEFFEGEWGEHEKVAREIIKKKGLEEEFRKAELETFELARDFLCDIKGWCLIHNPSGFGGYDVTYLKDLTRKQKDFLYGYFIDMGDTLKAEKYLND